ncbi:MAG: AAA family ATPase [Alphaproteobacteria bacterium]|nr:AAA family ATPase [Alphaproteobacteria bacterium]
MSVLSLSTPLRGHAAVVLSQLEREIAAGTLAHGILLCGPQGIGKATLAFALAQKLLGEGVGVEARIRAGSHPDLLVISRPYDEKKEEFAKDIPVEQTRKIAEFLSLTAGEGAWRVVIIDGADAMNMSAANSILKILEEPPPNSVLILVAHQASRLLPTIRSRCRTTRVAPLSEDDFTEVMRHALPDLSREHGRRLGELSDYAPGLALTLHEQEALDMQDQMELIFAGLPRIAHERVLAMAEQVGSGKQHANWQLFSRLALHWMARQAHITGSSHWAEGWQQTSQTFATCEARHLDYKSAVISFFHSLPNLQPTARSA